MRIIPATVIDFLPIDWWKPANLHFVRSHTLHFCTAEGVRTVEWDGKEIGRGRKLFPVGRWDDTAL